MVDDEVLGDRGPLEPDRRDELTHAFDRRFAQVLVIGDVQVGVPAHLLVEHRHQQPGPPGHRRERIVGGRLGSRRSAPSLALVRQARASRARAECRARARSRRRRADGDDTRPRRVPPFARSQSSAKWTRTDFTTRACARPRSACCRDRQCTRDPESHGSRADGRDGRPRGGRRWTSSSKIDRAIRSLPSQCSAAIVPNADVPQHAVRRPVPRVASTITGWLPRPSYRSRRERVQARMVRFTDELRSASVGQRPTESMTYPNARRRRREHTSRRHLSQCRTRFPPGRSSRPTTSSVALASVDLGRAEPNERVRSPLPHRGSRDRRASGSSPSSARAP